MTDQLNNLNILDEPIVQPAFELWGQCFFSAWKAALVKGVGKVPFDPTNPEHKNMVYAIDLSVVPILEQNAKLAERKLIQNSKEWELTQKSIKDLGVNPSATDQRYVKITFEPTGETYTNKEGDVKNKTYVKFAKIFATEAECIADYGATNMGDTAPAEPETAGGLPAAGNKEFEAAKKLLEATIRSVLKVVSSADEAKALALVKIKASPVMSRFFDDNSMEIDDAIKLAMGA